ncbi:hypothetical protein RCJ22_23980 [Vibrio sp. FNV 38]|nr:hypothetical protein [Vibrio sp. FNV 38]
MSLIFLRKIFSFTPFLLLILCQNVAANPYTYSIYHRDGLLERNQKISVQILESEIRKYYADVNVLDSWLVGKNGTLTKTRYFLDEKKAIYYGFTELRVINDIAFSHHMGLLYNNKIYDFLELKEDSDSSDNSTILLEGKVGDIDVSITKDSAGVPLKVEMKKPMLYSLYSLEKVGEQVASLEIPSGFELYDLSDLGDMEYDPFVQRVASLGLLEQRDVTVNNGDNGYTLHFH